MKLSKYLFITLFISSNIFAEDILKEFKIEFIIFKYKDVTSIESFDTKLSIPTENIIYFYDKDSNIDILNYSNFSNISKYVSSIIDDNKKQNKINQPLIWFRDSDGLDLLKDIEIKIDNDKSLQLIDSKSWLQTLPDINSGKYLFYESKNKYYGFLLNFYKKRFMHFDMKAYLGNSGSRSSAINLFIEDDKRIFNEEVHFFDHPHFGLILSVKEL